MPRAATLAALILVLSTGAHTSAQNDAFARLFANTLAKRQSITSIRARFTETTTSSLLQKPIVAHGTVVAVPPARVLMTYLDPERRVVSIDGQDLIVVWPDRGERERIDISQTQKRIDRYFAQASIESLRSMFEISAAADTMIANSDKVEMRPKRKQIKDGLERLALWIDRDSLLLVQMQMVFPGGDQKTIRLEATEVNVPITDKTFDISR